jgi:hypothetical protein
VQEVGSQLKNKKSRMELEREKQAQVQNETSLADMIYNSRMHQDHMQKQYFRNVSGSPSQNRGQSNSGLSQQTPYRTPGRGVSENPLVRNAQMMF